MLNASGSRGRNTVTSYDDEFARRDGFRDSAELREWFGDPDIYGEEEYDVIHFKFIRQKVVNQR